MNFLFRRKGLMIGKTVIHFITHGCMAQDHEFNYIGNIISQGISKDGYTVYNIEVLKSKEGEKRDGNLKRENERVFKISLQKLSENIYVAYD